MNEFINEYTFKLWIIENRRKAPGSGVPHSMGIEGGLGAPNIELLFHPANKGTIKNIEPINEY